MSILSRAFLVLVLVGSPVIGLITPYLVGLLSILLAAAALFGGSLRQAYSSTPSRVFIVLFLVLALEFALTAETPRDLLFSFNFSMLLFFGVQTALIARSETKIAAIDVSRLAGLGTLAAIAALLPSILRGAPRALGINLGPIVLSNCALALSAVAMTALFASDDRLRRRHFYLWLAPAFAATAALITGSRGPLLALAPLVLFIAFMAWRARLFRRSHIVAAMLALAALAAVLLLVPLRGVPSVAEQLWALVNGIALDDPSARARMALYQAGLRAFLDAPLLGHGWGHLMTSIEPHLAPEHLNYARRLKHLHNDILNFAVAGGFVGVLVYLGILLTPFIAALRSARDETRLARAFGTGALLIIYFFAGLTDLMFGQEFHTMLFLVLNGIVLTVFRPRPPTPPPPAS